MRRDAAEIQPTPPRADLTSANISASSSHPGCIQKTLEQISLYALIYVATEGTSFCKGAVKTYQLLATSSAIWVMLMIKTALAFAMRVSVVVFVSMVCYLYLDNQARDRRDLGRDMRGDGAPPPSREPHPPTHSLYVDRRAQPWFSKEHSAFYPALATFVFSYVVMGMIVSMYKVRLIHHIHATSHHSSVDDATRVIACR